MFNKESQFVIVIKYDSALKIDYKKLVNKEIEISDQTTFLLHNNVLSKDIIFKLDNYKEKILNTYTITLTINDEEQLIKSGKNFDKKEESVARLNKDYSLLLKKTKLFELEHYFKRIPLDYVFSPFHILNMHLEQTPIPNSLSLLVVNNYCYILIVDENKNIDFSKVYRISSFEQIKKSTFFNSDLEGQKLYDEIYLLELINIIKDCLKEYYKTQNKTFIQQITILYHLKQLTSEQVTLINEELLIDVNYHFISINESLYELSRKSDANFISYIKPKSKKRSLFKPFVAFSLIIIILCLFYIFNNRYVQLEKNSTLILKNEIKELKKVKLPNHIAKNRDIKNELSLIFDAMPYNTVLKDLKVYSNETILICDLVNLESFYLNIKPDLLKYYKKSEIKTNKNRTLIKNAVITNKDKVNPISRLQEELPLYTYTDFMPIKRVSEYLIEILPKNSSLEYKSNFKLKFVTYNYFVEFSTSNPKTLFEFINLLNKKKYSINISYPINMKKLKDDISISFNLQFHQTL